MTATAEKMLVIGAGPSGLAMASALAAHGVPYDQVEASGDVGGNWHHGVYRTVHIISSRRTTEYPSFPMPAEYPDFPSGAQMYAYYQSFADRRGLRPNIRFNTTVESAQPRPDELWSVRTSDGESRPYKGVVVCNGHHWDRRFPEGAPAFGGELIHSKDYQLPDQLRGKRVLVVGGGNSACDVASEAARVSASCDLSIRRGVWFLPKTIFGNPAIDMVHPWIPVWLQRLLIRLVLRVMVGRYESYGLPKPRRRIFDDHPTINSEVLHYLKHGRIRVRPDVTSYGGGGRTVRFADGAEAEYDLVVCATGFHVSFPFLPAGLVPVKGAVAQLYGGCLSDAHRHLYVVATEQARYGVGPLLEPLGELIVQYIRTQDRLSRPLGAVLRDLGFKPPATHVVDPHTARRAMWAGRKLVPALVRLDRLLGRSGAPRAPSTDSGSA